MKKVLVLVAATMMAVFVSAESKVEFAYEAGADVVSSYIWRGQYNGGLSFQPEGLVGFNALDEAIQFRAGVWANLGASDWQWKANKGDGRGNVAQIPCPRFARKLYGAERKRDKAHIGTAFV